MNFECYKMKIDPENNRLEVWIVSIVTIVAASILMAFPSPAGKLYNCSLSEISPDYPVKVKEECRKLRAEKFNKDLHKPK